MAFFKVEIRVIDEILFGIKTDKMKEVTYKMYIFLSCTLLVC